MQPNIVRAPDFALQRRQQIDSLKACFATIVEVIRETLLDVPLVLRDRKTITLRVHLPKDFPYTAPLLQVMGIGAFFHNLLTPQGMVIAQANEKLLHWQPFHPLGKIVQEVSQIFSTETLVSLSKPSYESTRDPFALPEPRNLPPPVTLTSSVASPPRPVTAAAASDRPSIPQPPVPSTFPELQQRSTEELQNLINDPEAFEALFQSFDSVSTMKRLRDDLAAERDEHIANREKQERALAATLDQLEHSRTQLAEEQARLVALKAQQQVVLQRTSPAALAKLLDEGSAAATVQSDAALAQLIAAPAGTPEFNEKLKKFIEARKLFHSRQLKKHVVLHPN